MEPLMTSAHPRARRRSAHALGRGLLALALVSTAACSTDKILKVDRPDIIDPNGLNNSNGVSALYAGVIGDFSAANANALGVIAFSGLMADEFRFGATPPEVRQVDQRSAPESNTLVATMYRLLQQLRGQSDRAATALKGVNASDPRVGEMEAMSGYAHVMLAELFCSGVPLGQPGENAAPQTQAQVLTAGIGKLASAVTNSGSDVRARSFASVIRGRALLNAGLFDQAAAAVASVATDFQYTTLHSLTTDAQKNGFQDYMNNNDGILVSDREGTNGLNFGTANDPRVPITGNGGPSRFDGQTPRYYYAYANSFTTPMPIATGVEARLIEAEAALRANNFTLWISKLNAARAPYSMPNLTDPGTAAGRVDLMFRERAFALFASGHRLGDLRRLVRQYGRGAETVYPTGAYHKDGLTLGSDIQFIIPQTEKNNPNFTGCIDRNA
jgi:starch-binding outer membrane protein, SusD/RagB family